MSEEDVRGGLVDAVGDEPPLNFDPDVLVATARQQVTRRRALLAVGVTTVAVAVAAVAVPVVLGRTQHTQVGAPPAVVSSTSTAPPTTPSVGWPSRVEPVLYTPDELRVIGDKLRSVLVRKVPQLLPGATAFEFGQFGGEAEGQYYEGQTSVNTHVSFTMKGERYSLYVDVTAPGGVEDGPKTICASTGADCRQVGVQDGGPLVAKTEVLDESILSTVYHFRVTGGQVLVTAYNYDMASRVPPTYLPVVPVTLDQLTALATDPELTM
jgi:hypothetical protein